MRGGIKLALVLSFAAASCASPAPETKIRAAGATPASGSVADAEGQLALGNVALAMESFRKALRDKPNDLRALSGLALCYDRMGRFDLSRKWFETALSIAPDDPELLGEFASSLDLQGNRDEAAAVRAEATADARLTSPATIAELARHSAQAMQAKGSGSVTVTLPAPAVAEVTSTSVAAAEPTSRSPIARVAGSGPRLERLSLSEVALITSNAPIWQAAAKEAPAQWVALRQAPSQLPARLLNAARTQGLAARTREHLRDRGWRQIEIGDAPAVRERTLILYPQAERARAERLVAELGFGVAQPSFAGQITVLLGRDVARSQVRRPV